MRTMKCKLGPVQWKPVNFGAYGSLYEASNTGQIRRIGKHKPLRGQPKKKGYLRVTLWLKPRRETPNLRGVHFHVHRLIALTFVPNPDNKAYVNHIDGHKQNNRADNLEWCTMDENNAHALATGLNHASKKRSTYDTGARSPMCR
jgi:hypothetical protein